MEYVVLKDFADLQDNRHVYHTGDKFPRDGAKVSDDRIKELASKKNKRKEALIKVVEMPKKKAPVEDAPIEEVVEEAEVPTEEPKEEKPKKSNKRAIKKDSEKEK